MSQKILITASILAADLGRLEEEVKSVEGLVDWIQVDVMDGHFVKNLTFGAPIINSIKTKLPLDIHLMVSNPADRIDEFIKVGAHHITFHAEAVKKTGDRKALIKKIRDGGATAGIAINPETPVSEIDDVAGDVDLVLVMSVHPGFSGQKFITDVLKKVTAIRKSRPDVMIQMDGGISPDNAQECIKAGANNLVAASAIFGEKDRKAAIKALRGI